MSRARLEAIKTSGELELEEAIPSLLYILESETDEVRMAGAWALSEIGGDQARDGIENLIAKTEDDTRQQTPQSSSAEPPRQPCHAPRAPPHVQHHQHCNAACLA